MHGFEHVVLNSLTLQRIRKRKYPFMYTERRIPKKNGKIRRIQMPNPATANAGVLLSEILQMITGPLTYPDGGFLKLGCYSYSKIPNAMFVMASKFRECKHIIHLDIADFFDTMDSSMIFIQILGLLGTLHEMRGKRFEGTFENFASACSHACTIPDPDGYSEYPRYAVQGSPLTPIISNLLGATMIDLPISWITPKPLVYARFSDDIYLGTNDDPEPLAALAISKINETYFKVNEAKTEIMHRDDPSRFPQVLSLYCDTHGHLKIPSRKGRMMKVAAFKAGLEPVTKKNFKMHLHYKGLLAYTRALVRYNHGLSTTPVLSPRPDFKSSWHHTKKLEADMMKSYMSGLRIRLRDSIQLALEVAIKNGLE